MRRRIVAPGQPLTVCLVVYHFDSRSGGSQMQARKQAARLLALGHRVHVVTWQYDEQLPRLESAPGWRLVRVPILKIGGRQRLGAFTFPISGTRMLAAIVREARSADIIQAYQMLREAFLACVAGVLLGRPVVIKVACEARWPEGDVPIMRAGRVHPPFSAQMLGFMRRTATAVIAPGRAMVGELVGVGFRCVRNIPHGTDIAAVPDRMAARRHLNEVLGLGETQPVVMFVGRLTRQKGADLLLHAWRSIHTAVPEAVLVLVGNGPGLQNLRSQAQTLDDSVRFCMDVVDGQQFLASADVVAVPSRGEGMSNVLLEAMAAGTPCVATDASGSPDLITDGVHGRLIPIGDEAALAEAIVWLLRHPAEAVLLGQRARERITTEFTIDSVIDRYTDLYHRLLSDAGSSGHCTSQVQRQPAPLSQE